MKTSWVIGVFMLYLLIFAAEMIVTGGSFAPASTAGSLLPSSFGGSSNVFTQAVTTMLNGVTYFISLVGVFFLYSPSVFTGNYVWLWWYICLPIDVGMIFGVVTILRGSSSS